MTRTEGVSLELVVTQLNINPGYNDELMEKCPALFQYMQYVSKIREYNKDMPLEAAVTRAVDECIDEGILKDFLLQNKAEVTSMSIFEYDAELHMKMEREEAFEDGMEKGIKLGADIFNTIRDGINDNNKIAEKCKCTVVDVENIRASFNI